ncbi:MAG: type II toxin-antitoxin system VapC family toxin [Opitutaceae bacterium]|nr:type II toxin-antitoxin system VapC family toxin [Opitutaceae bacterium]
MKPYADTNFFTRLYLDLPESAEADQWLAAARSGNASPVPVTWLHRMELVNAFEFSVWLGRQGGHPFVSAQQAAVALATFGEDVGGGTFLRVARPDSSALEAVFEETSLRHTARHGFRTYDLLHVVSARILGCDHFFSFDLRARKLAALEGLKVGV